MPDYRRNRVPGGTYFFTVNLVNRRSDLLVREIETLRTAIRTVRLATPFHTDAWVVLARDQKAVFESLAECGIDTARGFSA